MIAITVTKLLQERWTIVVRFLVQPLFPLSPPPLPACPAIFRSETIARNQCVHDRGALPTETTVWTPAISL